MDACNGRSREAGEFYQILRSSWIENPVPIDSAADGGIGE